MLTLVKTREVIHMKNKIFSLTGFKFSGDISEEFFDGVYVKYDGKNATLGFNTLPQKARAYFLLSMKAKSGAFEIKERPIFDTLGPMLDVSRGRVMTVEGVCRFIDNIAALGMNMLMLYTEDTYEIKNRPQFGYLRGRYTAEELKSIDIYAKSMGVELIPCIQTFGHLEQYIKNPEGKAMSDNERVLMAGDEAVYEFIEDEIRTVREAFSTDRVHLGMDETFRLGLGRYLKKNGYRKSIDIYNEHLARVLEISGKYFKQPMIWSDMLMTAPDGKLYSEEWTPDSEYINKILKGVHVVYWDYYHDRYNFYEKNIKNHQLIGCKTLFGGGVWTWDGIAPNFEYTLKTMKPALDACIDGGIKEVIATMWVSGGCGADLTQAIPGLAVFSEYCYRGKECTDDDIFEVSAHLTGVDRELFYAISDIYMGQKGAASLSKAFLFSDLLLDLTHYDVDYDEAKEVFAKARDIISGKKDYAHREFFMKMYDIAIDRARILKNIKKAYKSEDRAYLKLAADEILPRIVSNTREFYAMIKKLWYADSKNNGFENYALIFGGTIQRTEDAIELINMYLDGKLDKIDPLECETLSGFNRRWRTPESYIAVMK